MAADTNLNTRIEGKGTKRKNEKWVKRGAWPRSRDQLFKYRDPLISPEWLKIEISNFACRFKVRDTKPKNEKWVKRRHGLGHVTYFFKFYNPLISLKQLKIQNSNLARRLKVRETKPNKMLSYRRETALQGAL